ncbi:MAG: hypothetical protein GXY08_09515 [Ruminococcus sp.]|nr:hypothetical protein [Ruminococcus sp.]
MKPSELKYITQDNIDEAHINITSADMFSEVSDFNTHMLRMQRKRASFLRDYGFMLILNIILTPAGFLGLNKHNSLIYRFGGERMMPCFLMVLAFAAVFGYFIMYRKSYEWTVGALITGVILIPVNYIFVINTAANGVILHLMQKIDSSIKDEAGYPHFAQLKTSYIRDEENAEEGGMDDAEPAYSFDKFRIKPEDDMGMLAENDIGEIKK